MTEMNVSVTNSPYTITVTSVGIQGPPGAGGDVLGTVIAGFTSGAGAVADTDTLLEALGKLDGNTAVKVDSDPAGITGADQITNMVSLTTAEYGAITPDASTLYVITDA